MKINSVENIFENFEYYLCIGKDFKGNYFKPRKIRLLGIIQEFNESELYVCNLAKSGKQNYWVTKIISVHESGLGKTEQEAIYNYAKILDVKLNRAYESQESIYKDLKRIELAPNRFTYFNYRDVKTKND
ncbi:MAG: hypothetical protein FGM14_06515 [Flavobacteriales bacterium]|nr:hypothetical protein [Flavobacteriales bacterium]